MPALRLGRALELDRALPLVLPLVGVQLPELCDGGALPLGHRVCGALLLRAHQIDPRQTIRVANPFAVSARGAGRLRCGLSPGEWDVTGEPSLRVRMKTHR